MAKEFDYYAKKATVALKIDDYYVWDCSVIKADGKYHMFSSMWKKDLGFGWNWVFHSKIIHSVSDKPEGPYTFKNVVFERRGREFFDGMNTHNTCIKEYKGKYYLYYMGTTYGIEPPKHATEIPMELAWEIWNKKRIGLAVADDINGEFVRRDTPILEPRDCRYWDCTITTNPMVTILPNGKTYMIYKSKRAFGKPLQLGTAVADSPDGVFERISDEPLFSFDSDNSNIEDPFIWYDAKKNKFCLIAKDDVKNGEKGVTGEWGNGFYAESDNCIDFKIPENPTVYTRDVIWPDGSTSKQCNLERPSILFDENGEPTHIFCASGTGKAPYCFEGETYIVCLKLEKK